MDTTTDRLVERQPIQIFDPKQENEQYLKFRIPNMIITEYDTLLLAWEMRKEINTDEGDTELTVRRSTDGGKSFEIVLTVDSGDKPLTNPVMIVDKEGTIHLLYACAVGNDGVYHRFSTKEQDGRVWSEPTNIVTSLKKGELGWTMCNPGPGHGICVQTGEYAGRLIAPIWCYTGKYEVFTVYSDDNGNSWNLGERASKNLDETSIAELSDGSVMLNSRQFSVGYTVTGEWAKAYSKPKDENEAYRYITVSKTGIGDWCETYLHTALPQPALQGGMCTTITTDQNGNQKNVLLFVNCKTKIGFKRLTVSGSLDDGKTWPHELVINEDAGGYADIAVDSKGMVYVLYEMLYPDRVWLKLVSFNMEELLTKEY